MSGKASTDGKKPGLRERKKLKTREAIQRAAIRLFSRQGYEQTTIEEIAAAADISPSTFFNYFATKEDVVMLDVYDPIALDVLAQRPENEPVSRTFREVLHSLAAVLDRDRDFILARARLIFHEPELRSRMWDEVERNQALFVPLLARRTRRDPDDFQLRVTVRAVISAMYEAGLDWMRSDGKEDLIPLMIRALDVIGADARLDALQPKASRPRRGSGTQRPGRGEDG